MTITRREALGGLSAGLAMGMSWPLPAMAQQGRVLEFQLLGFVLGIQVPAVAAIFELLPAMRGYAPPKTARINEIRVVTQTMVAGAAEIGETDPPTVFSAVEAGAKLKIVGKLYDKTSLVVVVNADRVKTLADLGKPETRIAIGARGDITHILIAEAMVKHGIAPDKATMLEMPGSGTRVSALLSNRIDVGTVHFDQVESIAKKGNFKALIEPWKEFKGWTNEVWVVRADWLAKPENERAVVDVLKATILAFRKANSDFGWYLERYRKYASLPDAKDATEASLKPIWERLRGEIGAWPEDMKLSTGELQELLPGYKAADAIRGTVKLEEVVDTRYLEQALKELRS